MNAASWIILAIVIIIVAVALYFAFRNKKSCCNCGKDDCPMKNKHKK